MALWRSICACLLAVFLGNVLPFAALAADEAHVLVITDFHGAIDGAGRDVGLPRLTTAVKAFKAQHPEAVLVAAGDLFTGSVESDLLKGAPTFEGLRAAGLVLSAVGNHEFDWAPDDLARWDKAGLYFVGANIATAAGTPPAGVQPWRIMDVGGIRVAFVGLTTTSTPRVTNPDNVKGLTFAPPTQALHDAVAQARAAGAEAVIVLAHLAASSHGTDWQDGVSPAIQELAKVPGVTAVAYGHSHEEHLSQLNGVAIVQPAFRGGSLGVITLTRGAGGVTATAALDKLAPRKKNVAEDPAVKEIVRQAQATLGPRLDAVMGKLDTALEPNDNAPSLLGEVVCDALRAATGADVAFVNGGGLRTPLPQGPVTLRDLYRLMPFENTVIVQEMTGAAVRRAVEHGLIAPGDSGDPSRFGQMSGLLAVYDLGKPKGQRLVSLTLPDGRPVSNDMKLRVAMNSFIAKDGDGYPFLKFAANKEDTEVPDRDMLRAYLAKQETLQPRMRGWLRPVDAR